MDWKQPQRLDVFVANVRRFFGYALSLAQAGDRHDAAKSLKGFGGAGVLEVVTDDIDGTYRAVYTVKFDETVFVLHCFKKKSKRGVATPREEMDVVRTRLRLAEVLAKELRDEKKSWTKPLRGRQASNELFWAQLTCCNLTAFGNR